MTLAFVQRSLQGKQGLHEMHGYCL